MLPSSPATIWNGKLRYVDASATSVTVPVVVMRPMAPAPFVSVNHNAPSGPAAISLG
jgi:hypothetical protein